MKGFKGLIVSGLLVGLVSVANADYKCMLAEYNSNADFPFELKVELVNHGKTLELVQLEDTCTFTGEMYSCQKGTVELYQKQPGIYALYVGIKPKKGEVKYPLKDRAVYVCHQK